MSTQLVFVIAGIVALVLLLTIVLILTRYKKCKSNELLIVYGKTKGNTASKCYHGGSAFVWPVIQGYSIIPMDPFQIVCNLENVLSSQKIEVDIDSVVTVAVSTKPDTMQNAAVRLLGLSEQEKVDQIKDIVYGQLRLIIAEMNIEGLISDRTEFLKKCNDNISEELKKFGLDLVNINISDIKDHAQYIENLGKEAASKAKYEALAKIEEKTKEGEVAVAKQKQEKEVQLSEITKDQQVKVAENQKLQATQTAEIEKDRATQVNQTNKEKDVTLREIDKEKTVQIAEQAKEEAVKVREVKKNQEIETADLDKQQAEKISEIEKNKQITIATNESEQAQKVAEQQKLKDAEVAKQSAEAQTAVATANADRDAKIAEQESISAASQAKYRQDAEASVVEAEQDAEARKETAKQEAIAKKKEAEQKSESAQVKATQEKEAQIAEFDSDRRKRTAEADKIATITENTAGVEVAKSNAVLGKEQAEAQQIIGESKAKAEQAVGIAEAKKNEEIALAEAKAEKAKQEATIMVGTEIEADRKRAEAKGKKDAAITEAEGEAEAIKLKALAEAEAIKAKKLAEAEGEIRMAEAEKVRGQAETENIANLARAGVNDSTMVSYGLREKLEGMIGAEMAKFEHIKLGNVTVVGGADKAAEFMGNIASVVQGANGLGSENLPGVMGMIGKLLSFDQKNQIKQPSGESEQSQEEETKSDK